MNTKCNTIEDARQLISGMDDWAWDFEYSAEDHARFVYRHGSDDRSLDTLTAVFVELSGGSPLDYDFNEVDPGQAMELIQALI